MIVLTSPFYGNGKILRPVLIQCNSASQFRARKDQDILQYSIEDELTLTIGS